MASLEFVSVAGRLMRATGVALAPEDCCYVLPTERYLTSVGHQPGGPKGHCKLQNQDGRKSGGRVCPPLTLVAFSAAGASPQSAWTFPPAPAVRVGIGAATVYAGHVFRSSSCILHSIPELGWLSKNWKKKIKPSCQFQKLVINHHALHIVKGRDARTHCVSQKAIRESANAIWLVFVKQAGTSKFLWWCIIIWDV